LRHSKDKSPEAEKQRQIKSFADLDNLQVVAEITIKTLGDQSRNEIKTIITPDHARYSEFMDERSGKFPINYKQTNDTFEEEDKLPWV